jgi:integrase/recombinase XerD
MRNIKAPKFDRKIPDAPDMDDVKRILSVIDTNSPRGFRDFVAISLLAESGMRISSLVRIRLSDINTEQKTCVIWVKGNKYSIEYCSEEVMNLISRYIENTRPILASSIKCDYLFINHSGKQITTRFLSRQIKLYARQAGVRMAVTAHSLRHFVAQDIIWNGGDLGYAQEKLNHCSIQVTKDIYGKLPSKKQREIMDRLRPKVLSSLDREMLSCTHALNK